MRFGWTGLPSAANGDTLLSQTWPAGTEFLARVGEAWKAARRG
jgi:hypothetical protein